MSEFVTEANTDSKESECVIPLKKAKLIPESNVDTVLLTPDNSGLLESSLPSSASSPNKSRYGRSHKPKSPGDFLSHDRRVSAIMKISPFNQMQFYSYQTEKKKYKPQKKNIQDEAINDNTSSSSAQGSDDIDEEDAKNWIVGDLVWAKIGKHPYWPAMIAEDPDSSNKRHLRKGRYTALEIHVQFFADNARRGWISVSNMLIFKGRADFSAIQEKMMKSMRSKDFTKSGLFVKASITTWWLSACAEAELQMTSTREERIQYFHHLLAPYKPETKIKGKPKSEKSPVVTETRKRKLDVLEVDVDEHPPKQMKLDTTCEDDKNKLEDGKEEKILSTTAPLRTIADRKKRQATLLELARSHGVISSTPAPKRVKEMAKEKDQVTDVKPPKSKYKARFNPQENTRPESDDSTSDVVSITSENIENQEKNEVSAEPIAAATSKGGVGKRLMSLFCGAKAEKACIICEKPGVTVRCRGPCNGYYHTDCIIKKKSNPDYKGEEEPIKKNKGGKKGKQDNKNKTFITHLEEPSTSHDNNLSVVLKCDDIIETDYKVSGKNQSRKPSKDSDSSEDGEDFRCPDCLEGKTQACFSCKSYTDPKTKCTKLYRCHTARCGKVYHKECCKAWPQATWSSGRRNNGKSDEEDVMTCPQHGCHTCMSDNPSVKTRFSNDKIVRCIRCPTSYHYGNHCIPAGSQVITQTQIICPEHYAPPNKKMISHVNAAWCFICATGGSLICCDLCPTAFHADCLKISPPDGSYICDDCQTGRFPLYGEIVWVKLGSYRWWPAEILFPAQIPDNILNLPHVTGEFAVMFFGSHDYYWVNRGRVFILHENDNGSKPTKKTSVDNVYAKAVQEALAAHERLKAEKALRDAEVRPGMKPPSYVKIKFNRAVGNVRTVELNISHMTPCECNPNSENPCAPDTDCLNRLLMVECNPLVCRAGERCNNQLFEKRIYPQLEPFQTEGRGWGLKTLVDIKKGDFVIEYVGEMIDESEYKKRLSRLHAKNDENYYFLTIDKDRLLDAGPKGNVSRFMNHSCQPNCETQKWTVNADTRVGLFALCDITAGSELVFNYNLEPFGNDKKPCMCGAPNCSGFIGVKANKQTNEDEKKVKPVKKKIKSSTKASEEECFICHEIGDLILCDNKTCPKAYHLRCIKKTKKPQGKGFWTCPWHHCSICQKGRVRRCSVCINSYCQEHCEGNIKLHEEEGLLCNEHYKDGPSGKTTAKTEEFGSSLQATTKHAPESVNDELSDNIDSITKDTPVKQSIENKDWVRITGHKENVIKNNSDKESIENEAEAVTFQKKSINENTDLSKEFKIEPVPVHEESVNKSTSDSAENKSKLINVQKENVTENTLNSSGEHEGQSDSDVNHPDSFHLSLHLTDESVISLDNSGNLNEPKNRLLQNFDFSFEKKTTDSIVPKKFTVDPVTVHKENVKNTSDKEAIKSKIVSVTVQKESVKNESDQNSVKKTEPMNVLSSDVDTGPNQSSEKMKKESYELDSTTKTDSEESDYFNIDLSKDAFENSETDSPNKGYNSPDSSTYSGFKNLSSSTVIPTTNLDDTFNTVSSNADSSFEDMESKSTEIPDSSEVSGSLNITNSTNTVIESKTLTNECMPSDNKIEVISTNTQPINSVPSEETDVIAKHSKDVKSAEVEFMEVDSADEKEPVNTDLVISSTVNDENLVFDGLLSIKNSDTSTDINKTEKTNVAQNISDSCNDKTKEGNVTESSTDKKVDCNNVIKNKENVTEFSTDKVDCNSVVIAKEENKTVRSTDKVDCNSVIIAKEENVTEFPTDKVDCDSVINAKEENKIECSTDKKVDCDESDLNELLTGDVKGMDNVSSLNENNMTDNASKSDSVDNHSESFNFSLHLSDDSVISLDTSGNLNETNNRILQKFDLSLEKETTDSIIPKKSTVESSEKCVNESIDDQRIVNGSRK